MTEYNVALKQWLEKSSGNKGDESSIERPDAVQNVRWQTRASAPSEYENRLGDALQEIFAEGIYDLPGIVAALNERGVGSAAGAAWTEGAFAAEMARLGY